MKKLFMITFVGLLTISLNVNAQHVFNKGDMFYNAGIGIPHSYGFIPTINFSGEYGVIPTGDVGLISFGGLAEFQVGEHGWTYYNNNEYFPRFYIGARAVWHVHAFTSDEFDAYGGVGLGVAISGKSNYYDSFGQVEPDVFIGGRWMLRENLGLFIELGYTGLSSVKFGASFTL